MELEKKFILSELTETQKDKHTINSLLSGYWLQSKGYSCYNSTDSERLINREGSMRRHMDLPGKRKQNRFSG